MRTAVELALNDVTNFKAKADRGVFVIINDAAASRAYESVLVARRNYIVNAFYLLGFRTFLSVFLHDYAEKKKERLLHSILDEASAVTESRCAKLGSVFRQDRYSVCSHIALKFEGMDARFLCRR